MKKLKLKALELSAKEILTREELKHVMGGSGSGSGDTGCRCVTDADCAKTECNKSGARCKSYNGENVCVYFN